MEKFSCLMSCYVEDDPDDLNRCLQSLSSQTLKASEILLVEDGPLTDGLYNIIDSFESQLPLKRLKFKKNKGLGHALKNGVEACRYDLIARMDADDICREDRFEKQIQLLERYPDLAIVGSWISEFEDRPHEIYAYRKVPVNHAEIFNFAKHRNPLNHVTVIFRKQAILNAGNYDPAFRFAQDYVLWVKMLTMGYKFANIPECLVNVKAGKNMIKRRGGRNYMQYELTLQKEFLRQGFINYQEYGFNVIMRSMLRLIPDELRSTFYKRILRK